MPREYLPITLFIVIGTAVFVIIGFFLGTHQSNSEKTSPREYGFEVFDFLLEIFQILLESLGFLFKHICVLVELIIGIFSGF
jgi:uncharacterized protein YneF (UPF0154 family)